MHRVGKAAIAESTANPDIRAGASSDCEAACLFSGSEYDLRILGAGLLWKQRLAHFRGRPRRFFASQCEKLRPFFLESRAPPILQ